LKHLKRLRWGGDRERPAAEPALLGLVHEWSGRAADRIGRIPVLMEVCGTHTTAFGQTGLRELLDGVVELRSGPGCPVCVTPPSELQLGAAAAAIPGVTVATFGDMLRVPFGSTSLERERSRGAAVRTVYSPVDALQAAALEQSSEVVFLAVGFETTAPLTAAAVIEARGRGIRNFSVLSMHKLIPPALRTLLGSGGCRVDAFILPGHVGTVTGRRAFSFVAAQYGLPGAVTGFTLRGLLLGLLSVLVCMAKNRPQVINAYRGVVCEDGNLLAQDLISRVFETAPASWRGMGEIKASGLTLKGEFREFDARSRFGLWSPPASEHSPCRCGDVLTGRILPSECRLFGALCTPTRPEGPCMVSAEGSCAAFYRYGRGMRRGENNLQCWTIQRQNRSS